MRLNRELLRMHHFDFESYDDSTQNITVVLDNDGVVDRVFPTSKPHGIAICGPGKSGKDLVSRWFNAYTILDFITSTSELAIPHMFEFMKTQGVAYEDERACFEDRANHRRLWGNQIEKINEKTGTELYTLHAGRARNQKIWCGIRKKRELRACKQIGLFGLTIWIERLVIPIDPSIDYGPEECDIIVTNNSSKQNLHNKLLALASSMRILKRAPRPEDIKLFDSAF